MCFQIMFVVFVMFFSFLTSNFIFEILKDARMYPIKVFISYYIPNIDDYTINGDFIVSRRTENVIKVFKDYIIILITE